MSIRRCGCCGREGRYKPTCGKFYDHPCPNYRRPCNGQYVTYPEFNPSPGSFAGNYANQQSDDSSNSSAVSVEVHALAHQSTGKIAFCICCGSLGSIKSDCGKYKDHPCPNV